MGGEIVREGREILTQSGIATYSTPEEAVGAFMHAVRHNRNQRQLDGNAVLDSGVLCAAHADALAVITAALREKRSLLSELEAKEVLKAYAIPVVDTRAVSNVDEALAAAQEIGYPVALKILSPDISHKSDVGGVALSLRNASALAAAAGTMWRTAKSGVPTQAIEGFTVQSMANRLLAHELIVGITVDPTFGPVILFGKGGVDVEVLPDKAIGFPPLNTVLAAELIARTRVKRLLEGFRNIPAVDMGALGTRSGAGRATRRGHRGGRRARHQSAAGRLRRRHRTGRAHPRRTGLAWPRRIALPSGRIRRSWSRRSRSTRQRY